MRKCPVCEDVRRSEVFAMTYRVPDGWPLPSKIIWHVCGGCGMLYGDGDFDQKMLNRYYVERYGYGLHVPGNAMRLQSDAFWLTRRVKATDVIVDFGGGGEGGRSILVDWLLKHERNAVCVGVGDLIPACDAIYASHVLEHVYDLPETMDKLSEALRSDGLLVVDVPDAMGLARQGHTPILDFNTKHINHFTLRHLLELCHRHGFEVADAHPYTLFGGQCIQAHFRRLDVAAMSRDHIRSSVDERVARLKSIAQPVNVWGLADLAWHLLSLVDLDVLDYVDSDPAYRGQTYKGKPVLERPTNGAPIVVMAQQQKGRLLDYIRSVVPNEIIEV